MACICDAYASTYYRRKPVLDDDDYDIDFYTVDPINTEPGEMMSPMPSPREQLEVIVHIVVLLRILPSFQKQFLVILSSVHPHLMR